MSYCRTVKAKTTQQKPRQQRRRNQQPDMNHDSCSQDSYGSGRRPRQPSSNIHGFNNHHGGARGSHHQPRMGTSYSPYSTHHRDQLPLTTSAGGGTYHPQHHFNEGYGDNEDEPILGGTSYHNHQPQQHVNDEVESDQHYQHQPDPSLPSSTSLHRVSYNPVKHAKMKEIAHAEEKLHEEYKAEKREKAAYHLRNQEPQRLGGNPLSLEDTRRQQQQDMKRAKILKKIEREDRDAQRKRQKQEKIDQYKLEQRKKAERLDEKKKEEERKNKVDLDELRRRRCERFQNN